MSNWGWPQWFMLSFYAFMFVYGLYQGSKKNDFWSYLLISIMIYGTMIFVLASGGFFK